jgi:two-component system sensor histidine kinase KdpD
VAAAIQLTARGAEGLSAGLSRRLSAKREGFRPALPVLLSAAAIAACTWASFQLHQNSGSVACFYLVIIVLTAYYGGFRQASLISVAAVACLDYFFNQPVFSFTVYSPADWVDLGAFEFTALVIGRLSNRVRLRELEVAAERRDASRLYQTARRILLIENPVDPGNQIARLIQDMFELRGVVLFDAISATTWRSGATESADGTLDAYYRDADTRVSDNWYCALRLGVRPVGSIALCGAEMTGLTASALASLAAIALERARSIGKQYHAEAAREAEQLRTAVLDALAHKFKTPMTVIRTAVAGLPAAGQLTTLQTELVTLVDQEASKLNDLACRLLETPALESKEFEPQREPLLLSRAARTVVAELDQDSARERFHFSIPGTEAAILADPELIMTAIAQLTDNALKYSAPGTPIGVSLDSGDSAVVLRIRSQGLEVLPADRQRIFERFYRAPGAQQFASGTGLGLSIVKTIAADHDGSAWAEGEPEYGTSFYLSFPRVREYPQ